MAFDQVAQPSAFAYAPSSSTQPKLRCDVFINHRGPDVKHTLAKAIYDKLSTMGVQVFLDDEAMELGDSIPTQIQEAMDDAFLHVAIFSETYAESPWCLAELSYMLRTGVTIIPIFYHVNPSHLRRMDTDGGIYAGSFAQHETKRRYTTEKLGEWKEALQTVSYRKGYELKNDDWGWVLEGLANRVVMAMSKAQVLKPTNVFGLEERVEEIKKIIQGDESAHIVGIVGMGGCGKTTLAKELYYKKSSSFSRCSFLYDIRDAVSKNQLSRLQKSLLEDLRIEYSQFESTEEGKGLLEHHLRSLRALIVLDDVDCTEQIDSLLPEKDSLGSGSLVIITTRNAEALTSSRISERSIYRMKGLSSCHAKKLFCLHAFQTSDAPDRFEDLVERAVESCRGLPLSLKVFGGQLCFKPREYWESQLNEIFRVLPKGILSSLRISYDALDSEEQECFLDVACFFIGEMKSLALQLWDGLGRRKGVYSWETLQNKCLVEVDEENRIRMHDHLRDLGREIANKKLPYRIWFKDQVNIIHTQAKERIQVRGIMAATVSSGIYHARCTSHYPPPFEECVEVMGSSNARDAFSLKYLVFKFKKEHFNPKIVKPSRGLVWLRCFNFKKEHFNLKIGELSRGLVWLRCFNFNHTNLSSCLSLESLRVLELYDVKGLEMIWDNDANAPLQLTELIIQSPIGGLKYFQGFPPSIKRLQFLRKIAIDGNGSSMSSLPNEFCNLNSLEYLQLRSFTELSSLPISFGNLRNLRHLDLKGCSRINTLPVSFKQLTNLRYLYLYDCRNLTFNSENSSSLQNMTKLEIVVLSHCELEILPLPNPASLTNLDFAASEVRNLPDNIGQLKKLETLSMGSCHLTSLPDSSGKLCSLKELVIRGCDNLSSLPDTFGDLSSLRKFIIYGCPNLKSLPATFWRLNVLEELEIEKSGVESLPETFGALANLHKLRIHGCPKLKSLPATFGRLNALEELEMEKSGVESLPETFGALANLRKLRILFCPIRELAFGSGSRASLNKLREIKLQDTHQLSKISISEDCCPSLETLKLCNNTSLMGIETLPKTLKWLELTGCLTPKQELRFKTSPKVEILEGLKYLRSLETLKAQSEWEVPAIQSLEQMQRLKTVELSANNFAALEPCIRTIKKWPSKIQVLARVSATDGVESILNEFPFVDSFTEEAYEWRLARPHMQSSDAAIVCFVIQCDQVYTELLIRDRNWTVLFHDRLYCSDTTQADEGWVWISVCDLSTIANDYNIPKGQVFAHSSLTIKRGTLVVGQKECVIEAFKKLLVLLKR